MFEYAIEQQRKHPPSRRLLASGVVSCLGHAALLLILFEYPQLLGGGLNHWLGITFPSISSVPAKKEYRSVMVLGNSMEMPPAEELKKYLFDWDRARKLAEASRPIIVQQPRNLLDDLTTPVTKPLPDPPATAGAQPAASAAAPVPSAGAGEAGNAASAGQPPNPATEPKQIPKGIPATPPPGTAAAGSAAANPAAAPPGKSSAAGNAGNRGAGQQAGVRVQGNVIFDDTKGINLDDYAQLVKDRCEEHWMIPSNLRTYQGSVTIVFYITKQGQVTGAKIAVPSGNDSLNISALSAVWESSPFPPLPRAFPADRVGARLVFVYNER